jgi:lactate permease
MGNMITIHNIVAVCAVLALVNVEGEILKKAFPPVILYGITLAAAAASLLESSTEDRETQASFFLFRR